MKVDHVLLRVWMAKTWNAHTNYTHECCAYICKYCWLLIYMLYILLWMSKTVMIFFLIVNTDFYRKRIPWPVSFHICGGRHIVRLKFEPGFISLFFLLRRDSKKEWFILLLCIFNEWNVLHYCAKLNGLVLLCFVKVVLQQVEVRSPYKPWSNAGALQPSPRGWKPLGWRV